MMAIVKAGQDGAGSLKAIVESLNTAGVPTRSGKLWSINLVAHELDRLNITAKDLRTRATMMYGDDPLVDSEEAFWRVVEEQRRIAERNGHWYPAVKRAPKRHDPVRHYKFGIGHFEREKGGKLICRFRPATGPAPLTAVDAVDVEVFKWAITRERRDEIFALINERILASSALVLSSSITQEQWLARQRAMRWK